MLYQESRAYGEGASFLRRGLRWCQGGCGRWNQLSSEPLGYGLGTGAVLDFPRCGHSPGQYFGTPSSMEIVSQEVLSTVYVQVKTHGYLLFSLLFDLQMKCRRGRGSATTPYG